MIDFFAGMIANDLARNAYIRAVRWFLQSPRVQDRQLHDITAADVGEYLRGMEGSLSKKKQHHSALRRFFSLLVERHVCLLNPALVARTERLEVNEGKTSQITADQSRSVLSAIDTTKRIGIRDRAIIGILMWTGVRAGSIARLRRGDFYEAGEQWMLRFDEKRRRSREIPVRHDLAMTGEITLSGRVLAIGGIKEKVLGAVRSGIREIVLPKENEADLEDIPAEVRESLTIHAVERLDDVLAVALPGLRARPAQSLPEKVIATPVASPRELTETVSS